jgi:serine/threonine protein kinase
VDEASDVFSFGVVLWELLTRAEPWEGMKPLQIMQDFDPFMFVSQCQECSRNHGETARSSSNATSGVPS